MEMKDNLQKKFSKMKIVGNWEFSDLCVMSLPTIMSVVVLRKISLENTESLFFMLAHG